MEGVECACTNRGRACAHGRGGVCVHGDRVGVYGRGGVCMGERECVCIWKGLSVHAWREREGVYMEGMECACMGTGRVCIWKG